ncbi:MAG: 4-hydroxy-tetrahydrodipicolinate synthase [Firmicutes bacterium HGW-Firmicutes-1]|jgi:4-hydroxy-tetrahydrodipicolinate synthase|nr:MAG: 4-hydroxy-tetrahydrodipicolinate synthase [Firmicutes bacterium HGW-Firmicutes-1]
MAIFTGSGVAIVTPFNQDLSINFNQLRTLIDFQIENGTDCIVVCGTTGEASTLTDAEQIECIRIAVEQTNKRVPVIAGTGSNDTNHGIELSRNAAALGVDGLLQVTPYYNKTTQKGLVEHFTAIASSVDIPIVLYNVPSRTGLNITSQTAATLSHIENIVAIKEASGNIAQVIDTVKRCEGRLDLYSGNDDQIVPLLALGGLGVISVVANILPRETHRIVEMFLNGDIKGSLDLQLKMHSLIDALFCEVNPIPVKAALSMMGPKFNSGIGRRPLTTMEPAHIELLKTEMKNYGMSII